MTVRIEAGSLLLTSEEMRILYQVANLGPLRSKYRTGNQRVYELLTEITIGAFTSPTADGNEPRQPAASEEREYWTTQQVAKATGLSTRTVRLACEHKELPAMKHNRTWSIHHTEATTFIAARRKQA